MKQADREIIEQLNRIYDAQTTGGAASFASLTGDPSDNAALASALDTKQSEAEVQTIADAKVESEAYGPTWDGDTTHAPSKNDVYDKIEAVVASIPPAHSGGVIGTAKFEPGDPPASVVLSGVISTVSYGGSIGRYDVTFTVDQPDTDYGVSITPDIIPRFISLPVKTVSGFQIRGWNIDGVTENDFSGPYVIHVTRLSQ